MIIEVAAPNVRTAIMFLRKDKKVEGRLMLAKIGSIKNWHGDPLRADADRGEDRNLYRVLVRPNEGLTENAQYIL